MELLISFSTTCLSSNCISIPMGKPYGFSLLQVPHAGTFPSANEIISHGVFRPRQMFTVNFKVVNSGTQRVLINDHIFKSGDRRFLEISATATLSLHCRSRKQFSFLSTRFPTGSLLQRSDIILEKPWTEVEFSFIFTSLLQTTSLCSIHRNLWLMRLLYKVPCRHYLLIGFIKHRHTIPTC